MTMQRGGDERPGQALTEGIRRVDPDFDLWEEAAKQGVPLRADVDSLYGEFWPEDEDIEEFLATLRRWRREGGSTESERRRRRGG